MTLPTAYIDTALSSPPPGVLKPAYGASAVPGLLGESYGTDADLDLQFTARQPFDPRITYTGASARMYFDSTGTLKYAPMNVIRNNTMQGAVAGTPGTLPTNWASAIGAGLSQQIIGTGTESGIAYIDIRIHGTKSGAGAAFSIRFEVNNVAAATQNQAWTHSAFLKVQGGTLPVAVFYQARETDSGGGVISTTSIGSGVTPTTTLARSSATSTLVSGSCAFVTSLITTASVDDGVAIDITLRIGMPQLQLGSEATEVIPTTTAAVYLPRSNAYQDHNPSTLAPLGFLIEEARTNSIRNNTMQGAVAGSPGTIPTNWQSASSATGITRNSVAVGTENGIPYVDLRYTGTASSSGTVQITTEQNTGVAALTAQVWTASYYLKHVGGTLPGNVSTIWVERDAGGASVTTGNTPAITVTSAGLATQRASVTRTLSGGATVAFIQNRVEINVTNGAVVDFTLRIGLPQLELGAFATSPILTSGAAATRLADSASITGTNFSSIWNAVEGTVVVQARPVNNNSAVIRRFVESSDGTINNRYVIGQATSLTESRYLVVTSGSVVSALNVSTGGSPYRVAAAYKADDFIQAANGTLSAADLGGALPSVDRLLIGFGQGSLPAEYINGHIQSLTYYRKRLSNQTLQTLTA
jgi:hypothetical protein